MKKINIILAIRSLNIGGAERQFIELIKHIDKTKFDVTVCTMYGGIQEDIVKAIPNITYYNLEKKGKYDFFGFYKKYKDVLLEVKPNVIYSFMGGMNLFSLWCKPKDTKIIWGFRASNMNLTKYGKVSQIIFWLQKNLSCKVDKIISNSYASVEFHKKKGFCMEKSVVIHNGIDTGRFKRDDKKRKVFREKYKLNEADIAVGMVARIDYMKGYTFFADSAKRLLKKYKNIKFFSIGDGDKNIKKECEKILGDYNNTRFIWLGKQTNVEDFYSGFDISSSSSFGEGFSNSIAEAMSCSLPCVVTDVGDSKIIVGDCGRIVMPNSVDEFSRGLEVLMHKEFRKLGECSRKRIAENFSIEKMVKKTEDEILKCVE